MKKVVPTWNNLFPIWWSFFWRFALLNAVVAIVVLILNIIFAMSGEKTLSDNFYVYSGYASFIAIIPISMWSIKCILDKNFKEYSVLLIKEPQSNT